MSESEKQRIESIWWQSSGTTRCLIVSNRWYTSYTDTAEDIQKDSQLCLQRADGVVRYFIERN
jgi:hypothetical protein